MDSAKHTKRDSSPPDGGGRTIVYEVLEVGPWWGAFMNDHCLSPYCQIGGSRTEAVGNLKKFLQYNDPAALKAWNDQPALVEAPEPACTKRGHVVVYDLRRRPDENWAIYKNGRFVELTPTRHSDVAKRRLKEFVRENDPDALIGKRLRLLTT